MATITVNIADTVGQESAIAANGGPVFSVEVTAPAEVFEEPDGSVAILGFGRVISGGPVRGYEVGFLPSSIVGETPAGVVVTHPMRGVA